MPYGVTPQTIDAYGELIFEYSLNRQIRRGDPVRALDAAAWRSQRQATGLTDREIAARVGLAVEQVTFIRNLTERRKFRLDQYRKLFRLGGGARHDQDRYRDPAERLAVSADALALRQAMAFAPAEVRRFVEAGWWTDEVVGDRVARIAARDPGRAAIVAPSATVSYGELAGRVASLAAGLAGLGLRRGDVAALALPDTETFPIVYLAVAALGAVTLPLAPAGDRRQLAARLRHARARLAICAGTDASSLVHELIGLRAQAPALAPMLAHVVAAGEAPDGAVALAALERTEAGAGIVDRLTAAPVAADPLLLLHGHDADGGAPAAVLTHHNVVSGARGAAAALGLDGGETVHCAEPFAAPLGLVGLHMALAAGAAIGLSGVSDPQYRAAADDTVAVTVESAGERRLWGRAETQAVWISDAGDGAAGRAPPGAELRVVAADGGGGGAAAAAGEAGSLQVRGCSVFAGYFDDPAANAGAFTADGWYRTGRMATIGAGGKLRLGEKISPL